MNTLRLVIFLMLVSAAAYGCRSRKPINVMTMPAVCDSTQASPDPNETGPQLPLVSLSPSHATVIGTVEEQVSRHPVRGGAIDLFPADSSKRGNGLKFHVPTDLQGGFFLDSIPPGEYVILARSIGHQPTRRFVALNAGSTDTVRFAVRRYWCSGY